MGELLATATVATILGILTCIDIRSRRLPDLLTVPLCLLWLAFTLADAPSLFWSHLLAAIGGYLLFYVVAKLYLRLRHQHGLGLGDAKLPAAGGT